jgi:hypothetical protein
VCASPGYSFSGFYSYLQKIFRNKHSQACGKWYALRSVEYFKTRESFDKKEFEKEVFQDAGIIKSFRNFDSNYREENDIELTDNFDISPQAVKKQARVFKSVLKLDKNFHIYIHGDRELIEQGVDKDGRKYYTIYYQDES